MNWKKLVVQTVIAGVAGAIIFWFFQLKVQGGTTIPDFIGAQIVKRGGYSLSPGLVGWVVHLGVSLSYAALMGLVMVIPYTQKFAVKIAVGFVVAVILGWFTNMIATPAIQITIFMLSGKGFPASLWPFNPAKGPAFWNHILFFVVIWAFHTGSALSEKKS